MKRTPSRAFAVDPGRATSHPEHGGFGGASDRRRTPRRALVPTRSKHRSTLAWLLSVCIVFAGLILPVLPASSTAPPPLPASSTDKTFAAGSYIIDMGYMGTSTTAQPKPEGLQTYGLIYELVVNQKIPVYWVIKDGKTGQVASAPSAGNLTPDLTLSVLSPYTATTAATKSYYSSAVVIPAEYMTDALLTTIRTSKALTAVRVDKAPAAFTAPVFDKINYWPKATLDSQNGSIAAGFYANAKIPGPASGATPAVLAASKSYTWKLPSQLGPCDDVFVMPHADPTWLTHQRLLSWNDTEGGYIWAGCHAVSVLEGIDDPGDADLEPDMNFLSTEGILNYGEHGDGTIPYWYGVEQGVTTATAGTEVTDRSDPIMQILGATELAHQNGSEQIYMPNPETLYPGLTGTSQWRAGVRFVSWDPTQADVIAGRSPGIAAADVYGRAFDDPTNGLVMYEGGHSINGGSVGDTPAQRAFFNFLLLSAIESAPNVAIAPGSLPSNIMSGGTANLSMNLDGGTPNYTYEWQSTCGGTFSNPSGTSAGGTVSTTWTAPTVNVPTDCQLRAVVSDSCSRTVFDAASTVVQPLADVALTKTGSSAVAPTGDTVTYTLVASNNGPATATGVVVTDTLPAGMTFQSASPAPTSVNGQVLTWNLGSLAVGAANVKTITVNVTASDGGSYLNTAEVTSVTPDLNQSNNTGQAITQFVKSSMEITKVARPEMVPGTGPVTYEYVVRNTGDNPLTITNITDNPDCVAPAVWAGPTGDLNGDGKLNEPYLGVDREIWRYTCTTTVNASSGDVAVAWDGTPGPAKDDDPLTKQNVVKVTATDAANLVISAIDAATVAVADPKITVTKTLEPVGQLPGPGQDATFRITVKNTGNVPVEKLKTVDGWAGSCSLDNTIPVLAPDEEYSYLCSATTPTSPTLTTVATDSFNTISWTGGSGWLAGWTAGANISVVDGSALPGGNQYVVQHAGNTTSLTRGVNLSGALGASLNFRYFRSADFNDAAEVLNVQVSKDGGAFTTITPGGTIKFHALEDR